MFSTYTLCVPMPKQDYMHVKCTVGLIVVDSLSLFLIVFRIVVLLFAWSSCSLTYVVIVDGELRSCMRRGNVNPPVGRPEVDR